MWVTTIKHYYYYKQLQKLPQPKYPALSLSKLQKYRTKIIKHAPQLQSIIQLQKLIQKLPALITDRIAFDRAIQMTQLNFNSNLQPIIQWIKNNYDLVQTNCAELKIIQQMQTYLHNYQWSKKDQIAQQQLYQIVLPHLKKASLHLNQNDRHTFQIYFQMVVSKQYKFTSTKDLNKLDHYLFDHLLKFPIQYLIKTLIGKFYQMEQVVAFTSIYCELLTTLLSIDPKSHQFQYPKQTSFITTQQLLIHQFIQTTQFNLSFGAFAQQFNIVIDPVLQMLAQKSQSLTKIVPNLNPFQYWNRFMDQDIMQKDLKNHSNHRLQLNLHTNHVKYRTWINHPRYDHTNWFTLTAMEQTKPLKHHYLMIGPNFIGRYHFQLQDENKSHNPFIIANFNFQNNYQKFFWNYYYYQVH